jgi:hypothetical protein
LISILTYLSRFSNWARDHTIESGGVVCSFDFFHFDFFRFPFFF